MMCFYQVVCNDYEDTKYYQFSHSKKLTGEEFLSEVGAALWAMVEILAKEGLDSITRDRLTWDEISSFDFRQLLDSCYDERDKLFVNAMEARGFEPIPFQEAVSVWSSDSIFDSDPEMSSGLSARLKKMFDSRNKE